MRFKALLFNACITGTLLLGSVYCGGWKWGAHS
jgi:hypothetical protein